MYYDIVNQRSIPYIAVKCQSEQLQAQLITNTCVVFKHAAFMLYY